MKYLILILFPFLVVGQPQHIDTSSATAILFANTFRNYEKPNWREWPVIFGWQSVPKFDPYFHLQIDAVVTTQELKVLTQERHIVERDLENFFYGASKGTFESALRDYDVWIHTAANPYPHRKFFEKRWAERVLYMNPGEYNGFRYRSIGDGKIAMAVKKMAPNKWHVSYALFMRFVGPWFDHPEVNQRNILALPELKPRLGLEKIKD